MVTECPVCCLSSRNVHSISYTNFRITDRGHVPGYEAAADHKGPPGYRRVCDVFDSPDYSITSKVKILVRVLRYYLFKLFTFFDYNSIISIKLNIF